MLPLNLDFFPPTYKMIVKNNDQYLKQEYLLIQQTSSQNTATLLIVWLV